MKKIRIGTVFSGIGAVEFALKRLNYEHEIIFACDNGGVIIDYDQKEELNKIKQFNTIEEKKDYVDELYRTKSRKHNFVKDSYLGNYQIKDNNFFQDVKLLDGKDFENEIDLFVGGSPCQSFSTVGYQAGLEDTRGTLFYEYARLVNEIKPKVFIYENVRGLFTHDKGKTWEVIKSVFNSLGYTINYRVINAVEFGMPQNRRRLFVVGYKKDVDYQLPVGDENKLNLEMKDFTIEKCDFGQFTYSIKDDDYGNLVFGNKPGTIETKYFLSDAVKTYVLKSGTKGFYQKPATDLKIARTLLSTMGNCHRAGVDNYITIDGKLRMLSEREALRLMGFTDDFVQCVSTAQMYKQAGNSIVVDVLMAILKSMIEYELFD